MNTSLPPTTGGGRGGKGVAEQQHNNCECARLSVLECTSCVMRYELSRRLFAERRACKFNGTPDDFLKRLQLLGKAPPVSWDRCVGHWVGAFNGDLWDQMAAFDPTNTYTQAGMFAPCVSWQRRKQWRKKKKGKKKRQKETENIVPLQTSHLYDKACLRSHFHVACQHFGS